MKRQRIEVAPHKSAHSAKSFRTDAQRRSYVAQDGGEHDRELQELRMRAELVQNSHLLCAAVRRCNSSSTCKLYAWLATSGLTTVRRKDCLREFVGEGARGELPKIQLDAIYFGAPS